VDIRIFSSNIEPGLGLPQDGAREKTLETHQLQWAFAGISTSQPIDGTGNDESTACKWEHWIDSSVVPGSMPEDDSGRMSCLPDGSFLEQGQMKNASGTLQEYEELWRDLSIELDGNLDCQRICAVAIVGDRNRNPRGMIIRIGTWIQGILWADNNLSSQKSEATVERYKWDQSKHCFKLVFKTGTRSLPVSLVSDRPTAIPHESSKDIGWRVVERYTY
jgi:hypothetical protein